MGVEPTAARAVRPAADFEDREAHRDSYTPRRTIAQEGTLWQGGIWGLGARCTY